MTARSFRPSGRATRVAAAVLLLTAAYLALRNAAILIGALGAPQIAVRFAPAAGEPLMRLHLEPYRTSAAEARAAMARGLARAPLSELPFLIAAEQKRKAGDYAGAGKLAGEAVRRQPRSPVSRGGTLQAYAVQARWAEALDAMRLLWREEPRSQALLIKILPLMAQSDPRAHALLLRKMRDDKGWRQSFLAAARKAKLDHWLVGELRAMSTGKAAPSPAFAGPPGYQDWIDSMPADALRLVGAVYDGGFETGGGSSRYAWRFATAPEASARIVPSSRGDGNVLAISTASPTPVRLAAQDLVLVPGRYRIESGYDLAAGMPAGAVGWTLACSDGRTLTTLALDPGRGAAARAFTAPGGCPVQRLTLSGRAPRWGKLVAGKLGAGKLAAAIRSIEIVPAS